MVILNLDNIVHDQPGPNVEIPGDKGHGQKGIIGIHHNFQQSIPIDKKSLDITVPNKTEVG